MATADPTKPKARRKPARKTSHVEMHALDAVAPAVETIANGFRVGDTTITLTDRPKARSYPHWDATLLVVRGGLTLERRFTLRSCEEARVLELVKLEVYRQTKYRNHVAVDYGYAGPEP